MREGVPLMDTMALVLSIISTLLTLGIGIWKFFTDKSRKEAERRAKEDVEALARRIAEQEKAVSNGKIHEGQMDAEEKWRKERGGGVS